MADILAGDSPDNMAAAVAVVDVAAENMAGCILVADTVADIAVVGDTGWRRHRDLHCTQLVARKEEVEHSVEAHSLEAVHSELRLQCFSVVSLVVGRRAAADLEIDTWPQGRDSLLRVAGRGLSPL